MESYCVINQITNAHTIELSDTGTVTYHPAICIGWLFASTVAADLHCAYKDLVSCAGGRSSPNGYNRPFFI